jgi:hypothetical protein
MEKILGWTGLHHIFTVKKWLAPEKWDMSPS